MVSSVSKNVSLLTCLLAIVLISPITKAAIVTTSIGVYDVTTVSETPLMFDEVEAILESQVWWNDQNLAIEFASVVGPSIGFTSSGGPGFAYSDTLNLGMVEACGWAFFNGGTVGCHGTPRNESFNNGLPGISSIHWAQATEVTPVPLPAALPLFGSALGLMGFVGWRKRKDK